MITSLFRKTTPLNYAFVIIMVVIFFLIYQFHGGTLTNAVPVMAQKAGLLAILLASIWIVNFIAKKNGLCKDSSYVILFSFLLLLFFPSVLNDPNLIISNFFILLAFRRIISLQSLKFPKEKIFDASLWIFVAALFHFSSILVIILSFSTILIHAARSYRSWLLPFKALYPWCVLVILFTLHFDRFGFAGV